MSLTWRSITYGQVNDSRIPPLLLAHSFGDKGYSVYVTDLVHMWTESMDRRGINKRALVTDTSIDPTDDDEQMKLLLEKIRLGVDHETKDSKVTITMRPDGEEYEDGVLPMYMRIVVNLPKPFRKLEWTLELMPCHSSMFQSTFTLPLLKAQQEAKKEVEGLLSVIREKDHVIQKLADKLEASGTELGQVFPSAAGKGGRKLTRKTIEERVAGLAAFNWHAWLENFQYTEDSNECNSGETYDELLARCLSNEDCLKLPYFGSDYEDYASWWQSIKGETITFFDNYNPKESAVDLADTTSNKGRSSSNASPGPDVQIHGTPPPMSQGTRTSPSRHLRAGHTMDDDETDDENLDAASQSQPQKVPDSFRSPQKQSSIAPAKKLGGIGGKKAAANRPSPTPPPAQPSRSSQSQTIADDDTTEGEDDFEEAQPKKQSPQKPPPQKRAASPTPPPVQASPKKTPKKGGLGKIGGKKKAASPPTGAPQNDDTQAQGSQMPSRAKHKLGHVGGKKDEHEDGVRGRSDEKEEEKPRESSAEARQRRKREMQERLEKEAARPKKKKRVF